MIERSFFPDSLILFFKRKGSFFLLFMMITLSSCMKWDYNDDNTEFSQESDGLFILCEGNFQYSNATLSFYLPEDNYVENEIFIRANGMKLGDVAQSMAIFDNKGWIVVNNSHVIFAIDLDSFKETGRIENFTSPRYIHSVNNEKAYVTQLWDNRIFIINPLEYRITGYIEVPEMPFAAGSTEQMVQWGKYVFCNCWSYQNKIIKIDTETDQVIQQLEVGLQPNSIALDKNGKLWVLTDGGYPGSPVGYEAPSLYCIDAENFKIDKVFHFNLGDETLELQINASMDSLYWINSGVWKMNVDSDFLPSGPFIESRQTKYYGLTVSPINEDVYVADAIDYSQQGKIYRYDNEANLIDEFYVGISPGAFCWKIK